MIKTIFFRGKKSSLSRENNLRPFLLSSSRSLARSLAKVAVDPPISGSAAPASLEVAWNVGAAAAALSGQKLLACGRGGRYKGSFEAISRSIRAPE